MEMVKSRGMLEAPERPVDIPEHAQWLGGVGAGSWFVLYHDTSMDKSHYRIQRFSPRGGLECDGMFYLEGASIDLNRPYKFTYLSHCKMCTIVQEGVKYQLEVTAPPLG